jgi:hypothetical protein
VAGAAAVLLASSFVGWRLLPQPPPDFTLSDLQGIYTGMVRSDGTNDLSTVTRDRLSEAAVTVAPVSCAPLFEATLFNQFPDTALDGVSTYWLDTGSASISLVTYRYLDPTAARQQFDTISTALQTCAATAVQIKGSPASTVVRQPVSAPDTVKNYLSYLVSSPPASGRFSTDVAQLDNTVTWQYRYDYRRDADYTPSSAQQLMAALVSQMRSVQDSHR